MTLKNSQSRNTVFTCFLFVILYLFSSCLHCFQQEKCFCATSRRNIIRHKSPHSPSRLWSRDDFLGKSNHRSHSEERKSPPPKRRSHCERSPQRSLSIRHRSPSRRDHRRDGRSQERDHAYKFVDHQERNSRRKF